MTSAGTMPTSKRWCTRERRRDDDCFAPAPCGNFVSENQVDIMKKMITGRICAEKQSACEEGNDCAGEARYLTIWMALLMPGVTIDSSRWMPPCHDPPKVNVFAMTEP